MLTPWSHRKRERLDGISDLLMHAHGASILDIGCHRGLVGYEFANKGAALVHGFDIDAEKIGVARALFSDVIGCESRFEVVDLSQGPQVLNAFNASYDIVLMLGVYHKVIRPIGFDRMDLIMAEIASLTRCFFAWNGFIHESDEIDPTLRRGGLSRVHLSTGITGQITGIWRRPQ